MEAAPSQSRYFNPWLVDLSSSSNLDTIPNELLLPSPSGSLDRYTYIVLALATLCRMDPCPHRLSVSIIPGKACFVLHCYHGGGDRQLQDR